ncbi:MAG: hypothetical protein ACKO9F_09555 [Caldilinea sp.]
MKRQLASVKRARAERYLLLTLIFFAGSVIVTRVYLEWANYPQIGGENLHIAHMLWGGLLLYAAALLPLVFSNRWALTGSAILSGAGIGLFIDEVGKFITHDNDYFYPPAAPIIYAFFLLSVLLFLWVRRQRSISGRGELYRLLERWQGVVDGALEQEELEQVREHLATARQSRTPRFVELSQLLEGYLARYEEQLKVVDPGWLLRGERWVLGQLQRVRRRSHRLLLMGLMLVNSFAILAGILLLLYAISDPSANSQGLLGLVVTAAEEQSGQSMLWLAVRLLLEGAVSAISLASLLLWLLRREEAATRAAQFAAVFSLSTVTLLTFYLDQFGAISSALYQLGVFLVALSYDHWHLTQHFRDGEA